MTTKMNTFYNKLKKYILKNSEQLSLGLAPHFKFNETTIIDPEVAIEIYSNYEHLNLIKELLEKEKDYSRLLKNENIQLQEELDSFYEEYDEDSSENITTTKEKEYVS